MRKILFIFFFCIFANSADLLDIIIASKNAEISQIKDYESKQAVLERQSVLSSYLPSISLEGGYVANQGDRLILTPKESLKGSAVLKFILYDGGAREARLRALKFGQKAKELRSEQAKNYLALQSVLLYFNALNLKEILNAKDAEINYLAQAQKRLSKFLDVGLASSGESEAINAKLSLSQSDKIQIQTQLENVLLQIEILSNLKDIEFFNTSIDSSNLSGENTEILALQQEINMANEGEKEAFSQSLPQIFIKDTYSIYKHNFDYSYFDN
ncbi:MAG: TolC family protein, partial [Campylobacter sp.]|nr:TolC family protein [Campylobacter sp.]